MSDVPVQYLTADEIEGIHHRLIERYGGSAGLRSRSLLESAAMRPLFSAQYNQADLHSQAASLMFGLAKNHAFVDGNKRVAAAATSVFLRINGHRLSASNEKLATFLESCSQPDWTEPAVEAFIRRFISTAG